MNLQKHANDTIRLQTTVKHVDSQTYIVEGQISSTGKTINVTDPVSDNTVRLNTKDILEGEYQFRDSMAWELYDPEKYERVQAMNHNPGPQAGVNTVVEATELPEATH